MLGMAANSSTTKEIGRASHAGASSERNIATPSPSGKARTSDSTDETTVPKMKGSAPYSSRTGSHTDRTMNSKPNASIEADDVRYISYAVTAMKAKNWVTR